jgi:hypothetical protein
VPRWWTAAHHRAGRPEPKLAAVVPPPAVDRAVGGEREAVAHPGRHAPQPHRRQRRDAARQQAGTPGVGALAELAQEVLTYDRLEFLPPFLESLDGKRQSLPGERTRKLQTRRTREPDCHDGTPLSS